MTYEFVLFDTWRIVANGETRSKARYAAYRAYKQINGCVNFRDFMRNTKSHIIRKNPEPESIKFIGSW